MSSIDQQFIEYIVKSLVGNPDAVKVERRIDEKGVLLELTVDPEDLGRVIGKRGATAQSLRTLLRALGTKNDARYNLKIVDTGPPRERTEKPVEEPKKDEKPKSKKDEKTDSKVIDDLDLDDETDDFEDKEDSKPSDMVSRTRAELADLDDLDV